MSQNQSGDLNGARKIALSFVEADYCGDEIFGASLSFSLAEPRRKLQSQQSDESQDSNTRLYEKRREDLRMKVNALINSFWGATHANAGKVWIERDRRAYILHAVT